MLGHSRHVEHALPISLVYRCDANGMPGGFASRGLCKVLQTTRKFDAPDVSELLEISRVKIPRRPRRDDDLSQ